MNIKRVVLLLLLAVFCFAEGPQVVTAKVDQGFWCNTFGLFCPAPRKFIPEYEANPLLLSPFKAPTVLNVTYFATEYTTIQTCELLKVAGCVGWDILPVCSMGGAPNTCNKPERILRFVTKDKRFAKNAGFLAKYWDNYPDNMGTQTGREALEAAIRDLNQ